MYLTQGLHRAVQQTPNRVATLSQQGQSTYAELRDRVARLAGGLHGIAVREGDRVALMSMNSNRYTEYFLAVPWAGAVLNPVNIRWSPNEVAYSLADSESDVLIVDDSFVPMVPRIRQLYPGLREVIYAGDGETPEDMVSYEGLIASSEPVEDALRGGSDLAGVFYTGGTTGFPKGVMLSHTNILTSATGMMATGAGIGMNGVLLHTAPMFHAADFSGWVQQTIAGGTHVSIPKFDPVEVLSAIERWRVTDVILVPTMIQMLVDHPAASNFDLSSLRQLSYGGSPISPAVLARANKVLPGVRFTQVYGMTETATVATMLFPDDHDIQGPNAHRLRSAGRAVTHSQVRIVDPIGEELPAGDAGEILVRGSNIASGYWNKPKESAEAFVDGWVHTGDVGYLDEDGYLYVQDRIKDMIVTGGENVYSTEVEKAIAEHPAVEAVAVVGLPDEEWGERVHAVIVLSPGKSLTLEELRDHARALIANYKVPRTADFVAALPVSGAGKVLKRELKKAAAAAPTDASEDK